MLLLWATLASAALAADPSVSVALVTQLEGSAELRIKGESLAVPLAPFTTLHTGDRVVVTESSSVELTWLDDATVEAWKGPAQLTVRASHASAPRGDKLEVPPHDLEVARALRTLSTVLRYADLGRPGGSVIRGESPGTLALDDTEKARVEQARAHYTSLRAQADADDILPELYLSSVLLSLGLFEEAQTPINDASERCDRCPVVQTLTDWLD